MLGDLTQSLLSALSHAGMKLTRVRCVSHASTILICCCISIAFAASALAAQLSSADWIQLSPNNPPPARSYVAMTYDPVSHTAGDRLKTVDAALQAAKPCPELYKLCRATHPQACSDSRSVVN